MKTTAAITTVLLLAGGMGAAAYAGQQTQRDIERQLLRTKEALEHSGFATIETRPFQKTLLGGTQDTVVTLFPGTPNSLRINLHSRVYNGPFPQGKSFGAAAVMTDVQFPAEIQRQLDGAFGGEKITLQTQVLFGGSSTTTYRVPAGTYKEAGSLLEWKALTGTVRSAGEQLSASGQWPGARLQDRAEGIDLTIGPAHWNARGVPAPDGLGNSESEFTLESLGGTSGGTRLTLTGLQGKGQLTGDAERVNSAVQYRIRQLQVDGQTLEDLRLELGVKNLSRRALARLGTLGGDVERIPEAELDGLLGDLLAAGPEFTLDRLSAGQGEQEVRLAGRAALRKGAGTDWTMVKLNPALLLAALQVQAHAETTEAGLRHVLGLSLSESEVQDALDSGEQLGMFVRRGGHYQADLDLGRKGLYINGQRVQ